MSTQFNRRKGLAALPLIAILVVIAAVIFLVLQDPSTIDNNIDDPGDSAVTEQTHDAAEVAAGNSCTGINSRVEEAPSAAVQVSKGRVNGTVQNQDGSAVAGALVVLSKRLSQSEAFNIDTRSKGSIPSFRRTTNESGAFSFERLPAGADFDMWVRHPEYAPKQGIPVRALGEDQNLPPVVLNTGYRIFGQITDEAGNPLAAQINLKRQVARYIPRDNEEIAEEDIELGRSMNLEADENGNFSAQLLAQGMWTILASHEGYASTQIHPVVLMGEKKEMQQDVILGTEHILAGFVRNDDGEAIAGARIDVSRMRPRPLFSLNLESNEDGSFEVRGLSEGVYGVAARADGYSNDTEPRVKSNTTDIELVLQKKGSVSGRVYNQNGVPVKAFNIAIARVARGTSNLNLTGQKQSFKSDTGDYTINGIEPGSYRLLITGNGYAPTYSDGFAVQRDLVQGIDVSIQKGGELVGMVVDQATGDPIAGATISIHGKDWSKDNKYGLFGAAGPDPNNVPEQTCVSSRDGKFKLANVFVDELIVEATHPSFLSSTAMATVHSGGTVDMGNFKLSRGGSVTGIGYYADGRPLSGGTAYINHQADNGFGYFNDSMRLDSRGRFSFEGLKEGSYKVSVSSAEGSGMMFLAEVDGSTENIYVQAGRNVEVELTAQQ